MGLFSWWKDRKEEKAQRKVEIQKEELDAQIRAQAIESCLAQSSAPMGAVIVDRVAKKIDIWSQFSGGHGMMVPKSNQDLVDGFDWWEIDINHAYNNCSKLTSVQASKIIQSLNNNTELDY